MDKLTCQCPKCGSNEFKCDISVEHKYDVDLTDDGDVELSLASDDADRSWTIDEIEGYWYCADCLEHIFTGTKEQFVEHLLTPDEKDE